MKGKASWQEVSNSESSYILLITKDITTSIPMWCMLKTFCLLRCKKQTFAFPFLTTLYRLEHQKNQWCQMWALLYFSAFLQQENWCTPNNFFLKGPQKKQSRYYPNVHRGLFWLEVSSAAGGRLQVFLHWKVEIFLVQSFLGTKKFSPFFSGLWSL